MASFLERTGGLCSRTFTLFPWSSPLWLFSLPSSQEKSCWQKYTSRQKLGVSILFLRGIPQKDYKKVFKDWIKSLKICVSMKGWYFDNLNKQKCNPTFSWHLTSLVALLLIPPSSLCNWLSLFDLILYVSVNIFSVMSGQVFLGLTSAKQGLMCLAQGHNAVTPLRLEPSFSNQALHHWVTALTVTYGVGSHVNWLNSNIWCWCLWKMAQWYHMVLVHMRIDSIVSYDVGTYRNWLTSTMWC